MYNTKYTLPNNKMFYDLLFQFSNNIDITNYTYLEFFKAKMRKHKKQKHVFIRNLNHVEKWELTLDFHTNQFENFKYLEARKFRVYHPIYQTLLSENITKDLFHSDSKKCFIQENNPSHVKHYVSKKDGKEYLILGFLSGRIEIWDWKSQQMVKTFSASDRSIISMCVNNETMELLITSYKEPTSLWCLDTYTCIKKFDTGYLEDVCFLDDAFCGRNMSVQVWNKYTGVFVKETKELILSISELLYSPLLKIMISCASCNAVIETWKILKSDNEMKIQRYCSIQNPFDDWNSTMQFLDLHKRYLLVKDMHYNKYMIDLMTSKIVWQQEHKQE